jgi:hypothetical protein
MELTNEAHGAGGILAILLAASLSLFESGSVCLSESDAYTHVTVQTP